MTILLFLGCFSQPRKLVRFIVTFSSFCVSGFGSSSFSFTFFSELMRSYSCPGESKRVLLNNIWVFASQIGKKYELLFNLVGLVEDATVHGSMPRGGDWGIFRVHFNPSPLTILWTFRHQLGLNKAMKTLFKTFTTPSAQTFYPEHFWRHLVRWLYKLSDSFLKMKILKT